MNDEYVGMSVNERLYISGYMKDFDTAIKNKDADKVREILNNIQVDDKSIISILNKFHLI